MVDPPSGQLRTAGLQTLDADPPIDETAPSIDDINEAVANSICNISAELLRAGGEAMIRGLHVVLTVVWYSGKIPSDWKNGLVVPIWKGKVGPSGWQQLPRHNIAQRLTQGACPFAVDADPQSPVETPEN